ncbi:MAG TPA: hypothetical protein VGD45_18675 [Steroidobacter sp.]|uniref:hypothetical protein n=1 Tax=Steroidobacter sp. TaxID=1978227 RepID=UPI002ED84116
MNARINKSVSIALATLALAAPFASQAHDYDAAMDSCINAFVASNLPKEQPVRVQKEASVSSPLAIYSRGYKIIVSAKGVESGKYLARGTCLVDRSGQVIALNGKPIAQKLAAR